MSTDRAGLLVLQVLLGVALLYWIGRSLRPSGQQRETRSRPNSRTLGALALGALAVAVFVATSTAIGTPDLGLVLILLLGTFGVAIAYYNSRHR